MGFDPSPTKNYNPETDGVVSDLDLLEMINLILKEIRLMNFKLTVLSDTDVENADLEQE